MKTPRTRRESTNGGTRQWGATHVRRVDVIFKHKPNENRAATKDSRLHLTNIKYEFRPLNCSLGAGPNKIHEVGGDDLVNKN